MDDNLNPLVSIGIPVRNGGRLLDEALKQIVSQTYRNIEIIISDNNSSDETAEICAKYQKIDSRIKYFHQKSDLSALENFRFVVEKASADYFMWAAHDDRHAINYVEVLLNKILQEDRASIVFPEVAIFNDFGTWNSVAPIKYDPSCRQKDGFWKKIINRSYIRSGYLHIYGLIRRQLLLEYNWIDIDIGGDRAMLFYLSCRGDFIKVDGTCFYCYKPVIKKTVKERAEMVSYKKLKPFPYTRLSWACAKAGCYAEKLEGRYKSFLLTFIVFGQNEVRKKLRNSLGIIKNFIIKNDKKL